MAMILAFATSLVASLALGWLLVRFEGLHARLSYDHAASGPQKFHSKPTPRIGGIPVAAGWLAGMGVALWFDWIEATFLAAYSLSLLPAFASGLLEDLTKRIGPDMRLWASFLSALVAVYFFEAVVNRAGLPGVDALLGWYPIALLVTVVGVGGVAHAVNIIDGYNGLAAMCTVLMTTALGVVSWQVGDPQLLAVCVALAGSTLGFFAWNYPHGRLFAGDGGAYLWGVSTGLVAVMLAYRHPDVSPWFPLVVVLYPVFETAFSIYRRKVKQAAAAGLPDAKHLHQLIYRRLLALPTDGGDPGPQQTRRNAATSPFLWALAALAIGPATLLWRDTAALVAIAVGFCVLYVWLYRSIVRFAVPRPLRRLGRLAALWSRKLTTN